jgi:hypothetical protein
MARRKAREIADSQNAGVFQTLVGGPETSVMARLPPFAPDDPHARYDCHLAEK